MPRTLDVLLDEHTGVAEIILAEAFYYVKIRTEFIDIPAHPHANTPAARSAFQHDGIADLFGGLQCGAYVVQQAGAFEHRHALLLCDRAGRVLQTERAQLPRRGSND